MTMEARRANGTDVGRASDVAEGAIVSAAAEGIPLALVRWHGEIFAIHDRCPHQQGSLCRGVVRPGLASDDDGVAALEADRGVVICPWHRWEYDLRTGLGLRRKGVRLRRFDVEVVDDRILVDVGRGRRSAGGDDGKDGA
jgi:nitrite reductase/ring-hydroxylating ferredoxin subunit